MDAPIDVFDQVLDYPNADARRRLEALVGLDEVKARLVKEGAILLEPKRLEEWSQRHHGKRLKILDLFARRSPLFVFAGDVGTGKTELASTFGDAIARQWNLSVQLFSLSLSARGAGTVGQMTGLISSAFAEVTKGGAGQVGKRASLARILLIDEADALAQSRELAQMHHEDRAGVNALVRGIDGLKDCKVPILVVLCTNRLIALDPAIRRRAAEIFRFRRPNREQRLEVLQAGLKDAGFEDEDLEKLADATEGPEGSPTFSYSDLRDRLLPTLILASFPDEPLTPKHAFETVGLMEPSPSFREQV